MNGSVLIGLSGGVDSAAAALILKKRGYRVKGLYIQNGFFDRSADDVRNVADRIGIDVTVSDLSAQFRRDIVDYFTHEYSNGRTPNPCVMCNKKIKFSALIDEADRNGIDFIATGHYARIERLDDSYRLLRGYDRRKDQSYFLFLLETKELSRIIFPNGSYTKEEIKSLARDAGLSDIAASESQEICFIPDDDYRKFIENEVKIPLFEPGNIVDTGGRIVGRHRGIHSVTVGQRRGLNIASERPYYVIKIDAANNEVVVGRDEEQFFSGCEVRRLSWIDRSFSDASGFDARTHLRYRHGGVESVIYEDKTDHARRLVRFSTPQKAVAPGQAAVFYRDDTVLGGGFIEEGIHDA